MVLLIRRPFKVQSVRAIVYRLWGIAVAATALGLLFISWPYISAGYFIEQAGQALHQTPPNFQQVISNAEQAIARTPNDPFGYQLTGQAHLMMGDLEAAVNAFYRYTQLRPQDPDGQISLGKVYYMAGHTAQSVAVWQQVGFTGGKLLSLSHDALKQGYYDDALLWAESAVFAGADEAKATYLQGQAHTRLGNENLAWQAFEEVRVLNADLLPELVVTDTIKFKPSDFLISDDDRMIDIRSIAGKDEVLTFFTNRSTHVEFLALQSGRYLLTIRVLNSAPPPIKIKITFNDNETHTFEFDRGNNKWSEQTILTDLPKGLHTLQIAFVNDLNKQTATGKRIDRNAFISLLQMEHIR